MASLANQTISSTYDGLIKTSTDQPVPISGVQLLEDGVGNSLALSVGRANQGVTVTGTLSATSITGVLADGVTATTQTLGDNSTKVATTAYVDAQVTASDLDFAGDSGTGAVDLDSQTFTIAGTANEIETVASGQTVTIGLPSSVTVGTLNATTLGGTLSTAAQPNITSVGTLSSLAVSGNLTVDTNTLYVDATNNRVGIGTSSLGLNKFIVLNNGDTSDIKISSDTLALLQLEDSGLSKVYNIEIGRSGTSGDLTFRSSEGEKVRFTESGNVGIGTSSPSSQLDLSAPTGSTLTFTRSNSAYGNGVIRSIGNTGTENATIVLGGGTNNFMQFFTNSTERMRIQSGGGISFNGDTAAANALDDYEEGTWTPVYEASGGTAGGHDTQSGYYTKIGNVVILTFYIRGAVGTLAGDIRIGGLPFSVSHSYASFGYARRRWNTNFHLALTPTTANYISLTKVGSSSDLSTTAVTNSDMVNATSYNDIQATIIYYS